MGDRPGVLAKLPDVLERDGWHAIAAKGTHWVKGFTIARQALPAGRPTKRHPEATEAHPADRENGPNRDPSRRRRPLPP